MAYLLTILDNFIKQMKKGGMIGTLKNGLNYYLRMIYQKVKWTEDIENDMHLLKAKLMRKPRN